MFIHKSHVQAFVECPRKLQYLLENIPFEPTVSMQIGTIFHEFARWFFEKVDPSVADPKFEFRKLIPTTLPPVVRVLCENFVDWEAERLLRMRREGTARYWKPIGLEVELRNEAEQLEGTIDRIDELPDGTVVIVEYKTGKPVISSVRRELAIYALLAKPFYPVSRVAMFNPNKKFAFVQKIDDRMLRKARRYVLAVRRAIELRQFPKNEDFWCITCPWLSICSGEVSWES